MSIDGTSAHAEAEDLPELVAAAVDLALEMDFPNSCLPEQGRLLALLAAGHSGGRVAETGAGCGVGLAWMVSAASPHTQFVTAEIDLERAAAVARLYGDYPNVTVVQGDWRNLLPRGPFDLAFVDGGGKGHSDSPLDPTELVAVGGTIVLDDFTPTTQWPALHDGAPDSLREYWLQHPALLATEIQLAPDLAAIVARRI